MVRHLLPAAIVGVGLAWTLSYAWSAASDPRGGEEASLFIVPLSFLLAAVGLWSIVETIFMRIKDSEACPRSRMDRDGIVDAGLGDRRRQSLLLSLPAMLVGASTLGFVLTATLYTTLLSWILGERRLGALLFTALLAIVTVWIFFAELLSVQLPLWPQTGS